MRKPIVAGNWKMNLLTAEGVSLVNRLKPLVAAVDTVDIVVFPPYTALYAVGQALQGTNIALGAQDAYLKDCGAYTGCVSPQMLLDVGCTWTIIGHSERRRLLVEGDDLLHQKARFALESGLKVMFCIGEDIDERHGGRTEAVLHRQVTTGLQGISAAQAVNLVIAYEPVWAIGTSETATPAQAEEAHIFIRGLLEAQYGAELAGRIRIQYGGGVKPQSATELYQQENIDGFLVGGASLWADSFAGIIAATH